MLQRRQQLLPVTRMLRIPQIAEHSLSREAQAFAFPIGFRGRGLRLSIQPRLPLSNLRLDGFTFPTARHPVSIIASRAPRRHRHSLAKVVSITTVNKSIPAADANRRFSELLRTVKSGREVVVTSHGKPIAKLIPVDAADAGRDRARKALFARLRSQRTQKVGRWTRDELYDNPR